MDVAWDEIGLSFTHTLIKSVLLQGVHWGNARLISTLFCSFDFYNGRKVSC